MNPKEKARELYNNILMQQTNRTVEHRKRDAKQCAFICIDVILNDVFLYSEERDGGYWKEVKIELHKL